MSSYLSARILVTGGKGFVGSSVAGKLQEKGAKQVFAPGHSDYDLNQESDVKRMFAEIKPEVVIHCAGKVGGVAANVKAPATYFYDNIRMNIFTTHHAYLSGVKKFVALLPGCAYPKKPPSFPNFKEEDYWMGFPEETSFAYSLARKMLAVQNMAYNIQYGFQAVNLIPSNLYGPRDNFSLTDAHVVPAMVRKFVEAVEKNEPSVPLWGTGKASRDFMYIEDCAELVFEALAKVDSTEAINIGAGRFYTIKEIAEQIAKITGFKGQLAWDTSKPEGQPHRAFDLTRQKKYFGDKTPTDLEVGLKKTVDWYKANQSSSTIRKDGPTETYVASRS
jgi:GDP-L-fucose synthase